MWVAVTIGTGVVEAMIGDPGDGRALKGHRTGKDESDLEPPGHLETAVGEEPVITDGHPVSRQRVEKAGQYDVADADPVVPETDDGPSDPEQRPEDDQACDGLLGPAGLKDGQFVLRILFSFENCNRRRDSYSLCDARRITLISPGSGRGGRRAGWERVPSPPRLVA
jgi:hypothetical protein